MLTVLPDRTLTDIMTVSIERKGRLLAGEFRRFTGDVPPKHMLIVSDYALVEKSPVVFC